jgi:4-amino-4-deoxy-L-arabinose transferase-like glycosyltransferase
MVCKNYFVNLSSMTNKTRYKFSIIILIGIILLGAFFRLYGLQKSPPSLNWDEAAWGYNAYSVSLTMRDEFGKLLPIFTRSFDEYKSTLPMYFMVPSIRIFGLNEIGVRFPSAFLGILIILLTYLTVKESFNNNNYALISAFIVAIQPWSVHFSRVYHDANTALFFLLLGFYLFLKSKKYYSLLALSMVSFMLSMYTYNSNKIIVPIFLILLILINRQSLSKYPKKFKIATTATLLIFVIPFLYLTYIGQAFARIGSTSIIPWVISYFDPLKNWAFLRGFYHILSNNSIYDALSIVLARYFGYFSPPNIFLREPVEPSTVLVDTPLIYPIFFVPWLVGSAYLVSNWRKTKIFLLLLLISPLPAALTRSWFQPGRVLASLFLYSVMVGIGTVILAEKTALLLKLRNNIAKLFVTAFLSLVVVYGVCSCIYLFDAMFVQLPRRDSGNWQPNFRETVRTVKSVESNYSKIIVDTPHAQPHIFYLFYGAYPPAKYQNEYAPYPVGSSRKTFDFGKYEFRNIFWWNDKFLEDTLFVGNPYSLPDSSLETTEIKFKKDLIDLNGNIHTRLVGI